MREGSIGITVKECVLERYETAFVQSSLSENSEPEEKATVLFNVFIVFIREQRWRYLPEKPLLCSHDILNGTIGMIREVNCFDLADIFHIFCREIGVENASLLNICHKAGKKLKQKINGLSQPMRPFDNDFSKFKDNQFIFDKHQLVMVGRRFFDPTFLVFFNDIDAPFDNTQHGQLLSAISSNNEKRAIQLLNDEKGMRWFDINCTFQGWSLLHRAADKGLLEVTLLLLRKGANPHKQSKCEIPLFPLQLVPMKYQSEIDSRLFKVLSKGLGKSFINDIKKKGEVEIFQDSMGMICDNNIDMLKISIENGLNINAQCSLSGCTFLHQAVVFKRDAIAKLLLEKNSSARIKNTDDQFPVELCYDVKSNIFKILAPHSDQEVVNKMIAIQNFKDAMEMVTLSDLDGFKGLYEENLINIDAQDDKGWTLLHQAVVFKQVEIVRYLLSINSNIFFVNHLGHTAQEMCQDANSEIYELLQNNMSPSFSN